MSEHEYQDQWLKCVNYDDCGGRIYLQADKRKACAKCERDGKAPATQLPALPEPYGAKR